MQTKEAKETPIGMRKYVRYDKSCTECNGGGALTFLFAKRLYERSL